MFSLPKATSERNIICLYILLKIRRKLGEIRRVVSCIIFNSMSASSTLLMMLYLDGVTKLNSDLCRLTSGLALICLRNRFMGL